MHFHSLSLKERLVGFFESKLFGGGGIGPRESEEEGGGVGDVA